MAKVKKKIPRRKHARPRIPQVDEKDNPGLVASRNEALIAFNADFCRGPPQDPKSGQHAKDGIYTQVEGDKYDGREYPVPDGRYRVAGSEWLYDFEGGLFIEAVRASAQNEYGGPNVIAIG